MQPAPRQHDPQLAGRRTVGGHAAAASWTKQYQSPLADEFRLLAFDLRGHGMSEAPLEPEHYTDGRLWADDLAAVIDELRLDRLVLVGWSYGPFVIGDYLRARTGRIGSLRSTSSRARSSWVLRRSAP
jgi:pimeloyl-ACP methyl ester carboxylesterase